MNFAVPATFNVAQARLPATYEQAKIALANCANIDECQNWADKAEALASYARMAEDDSLRQWADRIQARAVRRCQELLKQFPEGGGRPKKNFEATHEVSTRREAAHKAGLSDWQYRTAMAVGNVPAETFETLVESDNPPTVTQLAEMGKRTREPQAKPLSASTPPEPRPEPPVGFKEATHLIGAVKRFAEFCRENDPQVIAGGVMPSETSELREHVATIDGWLDRFIVSLRG